MDNVNIDEYSTEQVLVDLDKINKNVETAYSVFEKVYDSAFKKTFVSDIVNGEYININDDNIIIDDVDMTTNMDIFMKQSKSCTKQLYDYQIKAIRQILELEKNGYYINPRTGNKIVSNGWVLSLPIGSGKSIVFLFLALWYRNVPKHPIIVSTCGNNIPIHEQMQFKYYPFYYENCCYIEKPYKNKNGETYYYSDANCIVTYDNYEQQRTTVIITHDHLLDQMKRYLLEDFPGFCKGKGTNINICRDVSKIRPTDDIIIIPAFENNIKALVDISHNKPFSRIIIDDYTSMPNIDCFRQILASSTIFVSGSGFERDINQIPTSYYTLKYSLPKHISVVGKPADTYKGVVRNNIAMIKLLGSSCDFSIYNFVQTVEELTHSLYNCTPIEIYPFLKSGTIKDYMGLYFILINRDKLRNAITAIDKDYNISGNYKQAKYLAKRNDEINNFIEWVKTMATIKNNRLLSDLLVTQNISTNTSESSPIVRQICMCCKKQYIEHNGYGIVTTCCGAFYCEHCIKNATTHKISNKLTDDVYIDNDNYYCSCCRSKNPKMFINLTKKKDKSVYAYNIIDSFFKQKELSECIKFDYYFHMLLHGLTPLYHEGAAININNEIERGIITKDIFINGNGIDKINTVYSLDHLMIKSLDCINQSLIAVGQEYKYIPYLLFYNTPKYMESRIVGYMKSYAKNNNPVGMMKPLFMNGIDSLIGIHLNIVGIIVFNFQNTTKDGVKQLLGRCLRINTFNNKLTFFITPDVISMN